MAKRRSSGWIQAVHCMLQARVNAAAAAGALTGVLVLTSIALTGGDLSAYVNRRLLVQEAPAPEPSASGYDEANDRRQAEEHLNGLRQSHKSREQELKQNFRGAKIDLSAAQSLMATWKVGIDKLAQILVSSVEEFWNATNGFYEEYQQPVDDAFQALYTQQNYVNFGRQIKDGERQLKQMRSELKRLQKELKGAPEFTTLEEYVNAFESGLNAVKTKYPTVDPSDSDAVTDLQYEYPDSQDFYDLMQELNTRAYSIQTQKEAKRRIKDLTRTIKDQERTAKKMKSKDLDSLIVKRKELLSKIEELLREEPFDAEAFSDITSEDSEYETQSWDIINEYNEVENALQDEKNTQRTLKEKGRQLKQMERDCKRIKCQGTSMETALKDFKAALESMKGSIAAKDYDEFWSLNSDADAAASEFWSQQQEISAKHDLGRNIKEFERNLKETKRMLKELQREVRKGRLDAELVKQIESVVGKMRSAVDRARKAYASSDYDNAGTALEEAEELRYELSELTQPLEEEEEQDMDAAELDTLLKQIAEVQQQIDASLAEGEISLDQAKQCRDILADGRAVVIQAKEAFLSGDEEAVTTLEQKLTPIGEKFNELCGEVVND